MQKHSHTLRKFNFHISRFMNVQNGTYERLNAMSHRLSLVNDFHLYVCQAKFIKCSLTQLYLTLLSGLIPCIIQSLLKIILTQDLSKYVNMARDLENGKKIQMYNFRAEYYYYNHLLHRQKTSFHILLMNQIKQKPSDCVCTCQSVTYYFKYLFKINIDSDVQ